MELYCEGRPPPLLGGAKVCTGSSRVGEGCNDVLKMGVCMTEDLNACLSACSDNADCEMVVYYTQEMKGSCVLCADLVHTVPTPHEATRIYARAPGPPPPATPTSEHRGYTLDKYPAPPPPRLSPPLPPKPPPMPLEHMGWHSKQHFECAFEAYVEYTVDTPVGYTNKEATTRFECCNQCGLHTVSLRCTAQARPPFPQFPVRLARRVLGQGVRPLDITKACTCAQRVGAKHLSSALSLALTSSH